MIKFLNKLNEIVMMKLIDVKWFDSEGDLNNNGFYIYESGLIVEKDNGEEGCDISVKKFLDKDVILSREDWVGFWVSLVELDGDGYLCSFLNENDEILSLDKDRNNIEMLLKEFNEFYNMDIKVDEVLIY